MDLDKKIKLSKKKRELVQKILAKWNQDIEQALEDYASDGTLDAEQQL